MTSRYDLAVIGLGAIGSMALWRAAARGASVIGVDRYALGHQNGSSHGNSRIYRHVLFEGPTYLPLIERSHTLWQELARGSGNHLFTRSGGLYIGSAGSPFITQSEAVAAAAGIEYEVLSGDDLARRYPQHRRGGDTVAVFEPGAGVLNAELAIASAITLAAQLGADVRLEATTTALQPTADGVDLEVAGERITARRVIVATGAWFPDLVPQLHIPVRIRRSAALYFREHDANAFGPQAFPTFVRNDSIAQGWGLADIDGWGVKLGGGWGGAKPWVEHPDAIDRELIADDTAPVEELAAAALRGITPRVSAGRVCLNSESPDLDFILGAAPDLEQVLVATGFSGHGFKHAAGVGDLLAEAALEQTPAALAPFSPSRFRRDGVPLDFDTAQRAAATSAYGH